MIVARSLDGVLLQRLGLRRRGKANHNVFVAAAIVSLVASALLG